MTHQEPHSEERSPRQRVDAMREVLNLPEKIPLEIFDKFANLLQNPDSELVQTVLHSSENFDEYTITTVLVPAVREAVTKLVGEFLLKQQHKGLSEPELEVLKAQLAQQLENDLSMAKMLRNGLFSLFVRFLYQDYFEIALAAGTKVGENGREYHIGKGKVLTFAGNPSEYQHPKLKTIISTPTKEMVTLRHLRAVKQPNSKDKMQSVPLKNLVELHPGGDQVARTEYYREDFAKVLNAGGEYFFFKANDNQHYIGFVMRGKTFISIEGVNRLDQAERFLTLVFDFLTEDTLNRETNSYPDSPTSRMKFLLDRLNRFGREEELGQDSELADENFGESAIKTIEAGFGSGANTMRDILTLAERYQRLKEVAEKIQEDEHNITIDDPVWAENFRLLARKVSSELNERLRLHEVKGYAAKLQKQEEFEVWTKKVVADFIRAIISGEITQLIQHDPYNVVTRPANEFVLKETTLADELNNQLTDFFKYEGERPASQHEDQVLTANYKEIPLTLAHLHLRFVGLLQFDPSKLTDSSMNPDRSKPDAPAFQISQRAIDVITDIANRPIVAATGCPALIGGIVSKIRDQYVETAQFFGQD